MAADDFRVDPAVLHRVARAVDGGAEDLRNRLAELDRRVGAALSWWHGAVTDAFRVDPARWPTRCAGWPSSSGTSKRWSARSIPP